MQNNDDAPSNVVADGPFALPGGLIAGETYNVAIATQPLGQLCTIADGTETGTVAATNVATVDITCRDLDIAVNELLAAPGTTFWGDTNADGVRDSADDEFVEIMNDEAFPVAVGGMEIRTGTTVAGVVKHFTFPAGITLASKGRAVVFGGGTPRGSFGGAQVFTSDTGLKLTDAPSAQFFVRLHATDTFVLDEASYQTEFAGCTTGCTSRTRNPETPGSPLAAHSDVAGAGVLTSPGVAPLLAVPKLLPTFSTPGQAPIAISVTSTFRLQFNMTMNVSELTLAPQLSLGTCAVDGTPVAAVNTSRAARLRRAPSRRRPPLPSAPRIASGQARRTAPLARHSTPAFPPRSSSRRAPRPAPPPPAWSSARSASAPRTTSTSSCTTPPRRRST